MAVTEEWLRDRHILMQQNDDYISVILEDLRRALDSVEKDQYTVGRPVGRFRVVDGGLLDSESVPEAEKHDRYVPVYTIHAAAGAFGAGETAEISGWLEIDGPLTTDHFVATALGRSMEPHIGDGDLLLFKHSPAGTRQGKVVLAQWVGSADPDTGGSYAVKRYHRVGEPGDNDLTIELQSDNPEYDSIILKPEYVDDVAVLAEFVEVLVLPK
jgi:hypothetical protein